MRRLFFAASLLCASCSPCVLGQGIGAIVPELRRRLESDALATELRIRMERAIERLETGIGQD